MAANRWETLHEQWANQKVKQTLGDLLISIATAIPATAYIPLPGHIRDSWFRSFKNATSLTQDMVLQAATDARTLAIKRH